MVTHLGRNKEKRCHVFLLLTFTFSNCHFELLKTAERNRKQSCNANWPQYMYMCFSRLFIESLFCTNDFSLIFIISNWNYKVLLPGYYAVWGMTVIFLRGYHQNQHMVKYVCKHGFPYLHQEIMCTFEM